MKLLQMPAVIRRYMDASNKPDPEAFPIHCCSIIISALQMIKLRAYPLF